MHRRPFPGRNVFRIFLALLVAGVIALGTWRLRTHRAPEQEASELRIVPRPRIVSLSPATTESLFALGLGEHVVGVSRFCDFPEEVRQLPRVGGLTDVDIEAVLRLLPDVVVAPRPHLRTRDILQKLGVDVLTVSQDTLPEIFDSLWIIGETFDRSDVASAWLHAMETVMDSVRQRAPQGDARPRVLISVGRDTASFERIYIAGNGNFYSEVLEAVGGRNAYEGQAHYPMISAEGVVRMNPDIIIDIVPELSSGPRLATEQALRQWGTLPGVRAVTERKIHIITEPWAVRPGPRVGFLIERFAEIVQPH